MTRTTDQESSLLTQKDAVGSFAGDSNQGLCTYLNLAPNVETEEQKLNALDELIRKSWEIEALGLLKKPRKSQTITVIRPRIRPKQRKKLQQRSI